MYKPKKKTKILMLKYVFINIPLFPLIEMISVLMDFVI